MQKETLFSAEAPQPIGPYSQAVHAGGFVFFSGQIGIDPEAGKLVEGGVEAQTHRVFQNIGAILAAAGLDFSTVVKSTVFLKEIADFPAVNRIYAQYISEPFPARSTLAVKDLPAGAAIEIEMIAQDTE